MTLQPSALPQTTPVLVDSDVVSFLFKRDSRASFYLSHLAGKDAGISFVTWAELEYWALRRKWGLARYHQLQRFLAAFTLYESSVDLNREWARIRSQTMDQGRPLAPQDAWIAATALLYHLPLITHNRKHYETVDGLTVISAAP